MQPWFSNIADTGSKIKLADSYTKALWENGYHNSHRLNRTLNLNNYRRSNHNNKHGDDNDNINVILWLTSIAKQYFNDLSKCLAVFCVFKE